MGSNITITCKYCNQKFVKTAEEMKQFSGKDFFTICPNPTCKHTLKIPIQPLRSDPNGGQGNNAPGNNGPVKTKVEVVHAGPIGQGHSCRIVVQQSSQTAHQVFQLHEGVNTIGRKSEQAGANLPDHAIVTSDMRMSKKHCQITLARDGNNQIECLLRDMGSTNGTFIKGFIKPLTKEEEIYLDNDSFFRIGETQITVHF